MRPEEQKRHNRIHNHRRSKTQHDLAPFRRVKAARTDGPLRNAGEHDSIFRIASGSKTRSPQQGHS